MLNRSKVVLIRKLLLFISGMREIRINFFCHCLLGVGGLILTMPIAS